MIPGHRMCPALTVAVACAIASCSTHVGNPVIPVGSPVYVRVDADCGGPRGSSRCPYPSLTAALDHPFDGELEVRIAGGRHPGSWLIERDVHLTAWHPDEPPPELVAPPSDGPQALIEARGGAAVRLSGLRLLAGGTLEAPHATHGLVVRRDARLEGTTLEFEGFGASAVTTEDGRVDLVDCALVDSGPVYLASGDSSVTLTDSTIEQARGNAFYVLAGDLTLSGGRIHATRALEPGEREPGEAAYQGLGDAIVVEPDAGAVELSGVEVLDGDRAGINGDGARALRVIGGRIAGNAGPGIWLDGPDASADGPPTVEVHGVVMEGNRLAGIGVSGAVALDVRETTVRGVLPLVVGGRRLGGDGIAVARGARLTGAALSVSENSRAGLIGSGASGLVRGVRARSNDYGLVLQEQPADPLEVEEVVAEDNASEQIFEPGPGAGLPVEPLVDP